MIVLDASVLIAFLDGDDLLHDRAEALLVREADDELAVHTLTLAEVLVGPARHGRLDAVRDVLADLDLAELLFPPDAAVRLARIRAESGVTMPDCCVLLAAEQARARVASFDARLCAAASRRGLVVVED